MAMTIEDQGNHDIGFMWENQSLGFSDFDKSGDIKEKLVIEKSNQEEGNEGKALMSKKRSRSEKKVMTGKEKDGKSCKVVHEMHILNERERRKKIKNMFSTLHAFLPQLPSKVDKLSIIDEAVDYIKYLKQTLEKLEKQKQERFHSISAFRYEPSSHVINSHWYPINNSNEALIADNGSFNNFTNIIGNQNPSNSIAISVPQQQPLAFQIWSSPNVVLNICGKEAQFCIFTSKKPGLLTAIASVLEKFNINVIYANIMCDANGNRYMIQAHANRTTHQLILESTSLEEIYKQAAREIMQWIS
ncbi:hypothetical protein Lal_00016756 [Lupinus albus]|uniref:Putative transcription factor bHLH family n=1 Tax=Lupinus albus TaxID=3870 RepID=A0A6A4QKA8_LUPAL|nr:putative transcription factor bHLH family [Lupinus albus]KAF1872457.1 hypothetical protein Lal_00016756 [Lupinus albus]